MATHRRLTSGRLLAIGLVIYVLSSAAGVLEVNTQPRPDYRGAIAVLVSRLFLVGVLSERLTRHRGRRNLAIWMAIVSVVSIGFSISYLPDQHSDGWLFTGVAFAAITGLLALRALQLVKTEPTDEVLHGARMKADYERYSQVQVDVFAELRQQNAKRAAERAAAEAPPSSEE